MGGRWLATVQLLPPGAAARGEQVLPLVSFSQTADPMVGFKPDSKDQSPMMLDLKRTRQGPPASSVVCGMADQ
jgi:hypothetical protein